MSTVELILGDSMQIMGRLHRRFNMIFLDPPYFEWADKTPIPDHNKLSALCTQLLKPNGCIFLCGTQPQLAKDFHYWQRFFKLNFELVAVKHAGTPPISTKRPIPIHENIWCLWRKRDSLRSLKLDITKVAKKGSKVTALKRASRMETRFGKEWKKWYKERGYPKSVINVKRIDTHSKEYEGHPAQKPVKIMRLLIRMSTDEGDWILDPFAGVGTTLMVAKALNRNCLAIEINPEYVRLTKRRMQRMKDMKKLEKWMK